MTEETIEDNKPQTVGQILRAAREEKGIAIEAVAKILCIGKKQLITLEEDHESLVCDVYTLGFLRSYSHFLGVDGEDLVQKFKDQAAHPQAPRLSFPAPLPGRGLPSFRILGLCLVALLTIIAGWEWYGYQFSAPYPKYESLVVEAAPAPDPVVEEVSLPPALDTIIALTEPTPVILTVKETAWIEVKKPDGTNVVSREFQPGETYAFKDPQHLVLKTGNAPGIILSAGDKMVSFSDEGTRVKSNIPLDPEKWLEQSLKTQ